MYMHMKLHVILTSMSIIDCKEGRLIIQLRNNAVSILQQTECVYHKEHWQKEGKSIISGQKKLSRLQRYPSFRGKFHSESSF